MAALAGSAASEWLQLSLPRRSGMQRASAETMTRARDAAYASAVFATSSSQPTWRSSSVSQNMNDAFGESAPRQARR